MKFEICKTKDGTEFYFVLRAANHEIVATSEMYKSKQGCKKGIKAVKKCFFAKVVDLTKQ